MLALLAPLLTLAVTAIAVVLAAAERFAATPECPIDPLLALCALTARETLATGLIATAAAAIAAWVAWTAVQRQIGAEDRRLRARQGAIADALSLELQTLTRDFKDEPFKPPLVQLSQIVNESRVDAMAIDPRLGASLRMALDDLQLFQAALDKAAPLPENKLLSVSDPEYVGLEFAGEQAAFRIELLYQAFMRAAVYLSLGDPVPASLIEQSTVDTLKGRLRAEPDLGWADWLLGPRAY